ncbi:B-cell receptor CD22-like isoform X2 [Oryzias latipes]|uniref:B-cell receptor CD22-like isoform X2 n=1 Tax=Oryzias latipes TaxID=8090 RepID=UPI0009DB3F30|nr:B-cell receptor CD22-like isoform X2 [Oryzias latipes]
MLDSFQLWASLHSLLACGFAVTGQHCTSVSDFMITFGQEETSMFVNLMTAIMVLFAADAATCPNPASFFIDAPKSLEALEGTCLQIPCKFRGNTAQTTANAAGVWIRKDPKFGQNPENVVYNSSGKDNKYSMTFIGNLNEKNCTTVLNNVQKIYKDNYFFRVEDRQFTATASCDPVQIKISHSAWSPTIEIPADLKERDSVTVTCSAFTPCPKSPPELTWNLSKDPQRQIEENVDGSFITKIQETITLSDTHNGSTINCSVRYPVNERKDVKIAETQQTLNVSRAPTDTSSSGLVSITGGIAGAILLICLGFLIWWFKSRHSSSNQTHRTTQSLGEENAAQSQDIHYGEIVFSKGGLSSHSTQKTADQPCVVYSQINVGQSGNTQTGEDIYSMVKR